MKKIYLSIIIPVYNEEKVIKANLQQIDSFLKQYGFSYEIIIGNDGSKDKTIEEIKASQVNLILLNFNQNQGKGFVIKQSILKARGEFVVFMDADLATPITELPKILQPLEQNQADIVIGSRSIGKKDVQRSWLRAFLGLAFRQLKTMILGVEIFDSQCGFKGFKQEIIKPIFEKQTVDGWSFDVEILLIASKLGYRILEVPISWTEQGNSKMNLVKDIPKMFWELLKIKFRHKKLPTIINPTNKPQTTQHKNS